MTMEDELKMALAASSASIGKIISLGEKLVSSKTREKTQQKMIPFVNQYLKDIPYRVTKQYALLLMTAKLVSTSKVNFLFISACVHTQLCKISGGTVTYKEVKDFFKNDWAGVISKIHQPGSLIFSNLIEDVNKGLQALPAGEVRIIGNSRFYSYYKCY